jgi:hypothetical protein
MDCEGLLGQNIAQLVGIVILLITSVITAITSYYTRRRLEHSENIMSAEQVKHYQMLQNLHAKAEVAAEDNKQLLVRAEVSAADNKELLKELYSRIQHRKEKGNKKFEL